MNRINIKKSLSLLAFCAPSLLFFVLFMAYPMISGFFYSLTDWNGVFQTYNIVGISNYIEAFTRDQRFLQSLLYTTQYVVVLVVVENVLGLLIAVLAESRSKTKGLFRTLFFMPNIISIYISSLMWLFIFSKVFSQIGQKTIFTFFDRAWFSDQRTATFSIILVSLWQGVGYLMIIYIAALQGVPSELTEAAVIDGANSLQKLIHIIIPMIMPAVTVCLFLTLNGSFKIFEVVFSLTNGGPGYSTEVVALNIYREGFVGDLRFGYATAKSIILFAIILIVTLVQVSVTKKEEVEL